MEIHYKWVIDKNWLKILPTDILEHILSYNLISLNLISRMDIGIKTDNIFVGDKAGMGSFTYFQIFLLGSVISL